MQIASFFIQNGTTSRGAVSTPLVPSSGGRGRLAVARLTAHEVDEHAAPHHRGEMVGDLVDLETSTASVPAYIRSLRADGEALEACALRLSRESGREATRQRVLRPTSGVHAVETGRAERVIIKPREPDQRAPPYSARGGLRRPARPAGRVHRAWPALDEQALHLLVPNWSKSRSSSTSPVRCMVEPPSVSTVACCSMRPRPSRTTRIGCRACSTRRTVNDGLSRSTVLSRPKSHHSAAIVVDLIEAAFRRELPAAPNGRPPSPSRPRPPSRSPMGVVDGTNGGRNAPVAASGCSRPTSTSRPGFTQHVRSRPRTFASLDGRRPPAGCRPRGAIPCTGASFEVIARFEGDVLWLLVGTPRAGVMDGHLFSVEPARWSCHPSAMATPSFTSTQPTGGSATATLTSLSDLGPAATSSPSDHIATVGFKAPHEPSPLGANLHPLRVHPPAWLGCT